MKIAKTGHRIRDLQQQVAAVAYSAAGVLPFEAERPFFMPFTVFYFIRISPHSTHPLPPRLQRDP